MPRGEKTPDLSSAAGAATAIVVVFVFLFPFLSVFFFFVCVCLFCSALLSPFSVESLNTRVFFFFLIRGPLEAAFLFFATFVESSVKYW